MGKILLSWRLDSSPAGYLNLYSKTLGMGLWLCYQLFLGPIAYAQGAQSFKSFQGYPWPAKDQEWTDLSPGHPVLSTLACPTLTRLNLQKGESEPWVLKSLSEARGPKNSLSYIWSLELRPNTQWWDRTPLRGEVLEKLLNTELRAWIEQSYLGLVPVPPFRTESSPFEVRIIWEKAPEFGAYILNQWPLRMRDSRGFYMCTGPYKALVGAQSVSFEKVAEQKNLPPKIEWILAAAPGARPAELYFRPAQSWSSRPGNGLNALPCRVPYDLPLLSYIMWNPDKEPSKDPRFRKILTQALARGGLLRAGAGSVGDLLSGPILRAHPGYDKRLLVRPFDIRLAEAALDELGYKRREHELIRRVPDGSPLKLKLRVPAGAGLVSKVVHDTYERLGIELSLSSASPAEKVEGLDGILTAALLSWPEADYLLWLHSAAPRGDIPWKFGSKNLDQKLLAYSLSLSQKKPAFELLTRIHGEIYAEEPFSILNQHRLCLETLDPKRQNTLKPLAVRDPDWFWNLMIGSKTQ